MSSNPISIFDVNNKFNKFKNYNSEIRDKIIYCGNCGEKNHIYKDCHHPIISLGVLLFKYYSDIDNVKFLLVRRKDSIGYVEFIRGKYASTDLEYITKLFFQMSENEINKIKNNKFDYLWENLWMQSRFKSKKKNFINDNVQAKKKFERIYYGYILNDKYINIDYFINNINNSWIETEWGIPKGRRNIKESDYDAAKREFKEETGMSEDNFIILSNIPPFIEEYIGSDNIKYKHIYYLAKCIGNINLKLDTNSKYQITEISKIGMFDKNECLDLIRDYYDEKKKIIIKANDYIIEKKLYLSNDICDDNINNKFSYNNVKSQSI